jgi:Protein of unknown function (DUF3175)
MNNLAAASQGVDEIEANAPRQSLRGVSRQASGAFQRIRGVGLSNLIGLAIMIARSSTRLQGAHLEQPQRKNCARDSSGTLRARTRWLEMAAKRKSPAARKSTAAPRKRKWSAKVMRRSDALDLDYGVFTKRSPKQIAVSLERSALASRRRKAKPFQSAMSMLNFYINRGGRGLTPERRSVLNRAKVELRRLFNR